MDNNPVQRRLNKLRNTTIPTPTEDAVTALRQAMVSAVTPDMVRQIMEAQAAKAVGGDLRSATFLLRVLGLSTPPAPAPQVVIQQNINTESAEDEDDEDDAPLPPLRSIQPRRYSVAELMQPTYARPGTILRKEIEDQRERAGLSRTHPLDAEDDK